MGHSGQNTSEQKRKQHKKWYQSRLVKCFCPSQDVTTPRFSGRPLKNHPKIIQSPKAWSPRHLLVPVMELDISNSKRKVSLKLCKAAKVIPAWSLRHGGEICHRTMAPLGMGKWAPLSNGLKYMGFQVVSPHLQLVFWVHFVVIVKVESK